MSPFIPRSEGVGQRPRTLQPFTRGRAAHPDRLKADSRVPDGLSQLGSVVSKRRCPLFVASEVSGLVKSSSRGSGGGKVRIPRCMRDLQVERESLFCDFSS